MKIFQKVSPSLPGTADGRTKKAGGKAALSKQVVAEKIPGAAVISITSPVRTSRIYEPDDARKVAKTIAEDLSGEAGIEESHELSVETVLSLLLA